MQDSLTSAVLIVLGWLLGVLSPAIVDGIKRQRDAILYRKAIRRDLSDLRARLAAAAYYIEMKVGRVDRSLLEWIQRILRTVPETTDLTASLTLISGQLTLKDEEIEKIYAVTRTNSQGGLSLKKYRAPLLEAHLPSFWVLEESLQTQLLDVNAGLSLFNEEVESAKFYSQLTFSDITASNHAIAVANFRSSAGNLSKMARALVDKIDAITHL